MAAQDIDIGDGCKEIENEQEDSTDGHSIGESIDQGSLTGQSFYFERTFDFDCPELPTQFYFWVRLALCSATALSSVACVGRTDPAAGWVKATLVINIYRRGLSEATVRHVFSELGPYGEQEHSSLDPISQEIAYAFRLEGHLRFEVVLTVEHCHSEQQEAESTATPKSDDSSPNKRQRIQSSS